MKAYNDLVNEEAAQRLINSNVGDSVDIYKASLGGGYRKQYSYKILRKTKNFVVVDDTFGTKYRIVENQSGGIGSEVRPQDSSIWTPADIAFVK